MASRLSSRAVYNDSQISQYFSHISLPNDSQELRHTSTKLHEPSNGLKFLINLQRYQLAAVPFENLALHYSPHHSISLDPGYLFNKIVGNGRGGYCMENNCFFGTILRTLGFTVCSAGARVSDGVSGTGSGDNFEGWSHMVNIVTLDDGNKYMLDVGFGGNGPTQPLLLDANNSQVQHIEPADMRLTKQNIAANTDPDQTLWLYQHRIGPDSEWLPMYCYTELEFLPQDYKVMNFYTSQNRKSWFTYRIVCVKMVMEEGELVGTLTLVGGDVKRRIRGETEHLKTCENEVDRVKAMEEYFGIKLGPDEAGGIKGMVTALPS